jgi:hypothetical protein
VEAEPVRLPVAKSYQLPEKLAVIEFTEYPGLEIEVVIRPVPLDSYFEFLAFRDKPKEQRLETYREMCEKFRPFLRSDPETVFGDWQLTIATMLQWVGAVAEVPLPLAKRSPSGSTSRARRASRSRRR